jgi:ribosomal protein L11 methyltransferase
LSTALEENALALTVMQPPRQESCQIEAIFADEPDRSALATRLAIVAAAHGFATPSSIVEAILPEDWLRRVAMATPPRQIGKLVIYGTHDVGTVPAHLPSLHIDAATAFGTGEHPSTQMCLRLYQDYLRRRNPCRVLDIGCGSGILALAAARLAHRHVLAIDFDLESVHMTQHNARQNGLSRYIHAVQGMGYQTRLVRQNRPYDLVFANIFARPLMALAADLRHHLAPGGVAILAGLLQSQVPMVLAAHRMQRLHLVRAMQIGEWAALLLARKR